MAEPIDRHPILDKIIRRLERQTTAEAREGLKQLERMQQELDQLPPDADLRVLVQEGQLDSRVAAWDLFERASTYLESELERVHKIKETRELTEEELRYGRETLMELLHSMHKLIKRQFGPRRDGADGTME